MINKFKIKIKIIYKKQFWYKVYILIIMIINNNIIVFEIHNDKFNIKVMLELKIYKSKINTNINNYLDHNYKILKNMDRI
jgi:hypothetical protein